MAALYIKPHAVSRDAIAAAMTRGLGAVERTC
jgi:hypothetical protein